MKKEGTDNSQSDKLNEEASGTSLMILCRNAYISKTIQYMMKIAKSKRIKLATNQTYP